MKKYLLTSLCASAFLLAAPLAVAQTETPDSPRSEKVLKDSKKDHKGMKEKRRESRKSMTPEEREARHEARMKERIGKMSPEDKAKARARAERIIKLLDEAE